MPSRPWWYGSVTLLVNLPSQGVNWQSIGTVSLTGLPLDSFQRFVFTLPGDLVTKLAATYTDLQFRFVLNVPYGTGIYLLDRLWLGEQQDSDAGAGGAGSGDAGVPPTGEIVNFVIPLPRQVEVHAVGLGANGAFSRWLVRDTAVASSWRFARYQANAATTATSSTDATTNRRHRDIGRPGFCSATSVPSSPDREKPGSAWSYL